MGPKANESQRVSVIVSSLAKSLLERDAHLPSRAEAREALRAAASQLDAAERALLDKNFDAIADGVLKRLLPSLPTLRASGSSTAECARCVRNSAPGNASQLAAVATSRHRKEEQSSVEERVELAIAAVESGADVSVVDVLVHLASEREPLLRKFCARCTRTGQTCSKSVPRSRYQSSLTRQAGTRNMCMHFCSGWRRRAKRCPFSEATATLLVLTSLSAVRVARQRR
jgi:hypothetical protein